MGTQPATPAHVRVVLPDDTVLRVPITDTSTAHDLLTNIKRQCNKATQLPKSSFSAGLPTGYFELVLVRCGLVFHKKQLLGDAGVRDGDILDWRSVANRPESASRDVSEGDPRNNGPGEEAETRSSEDDNANEGLNRTVSDSSNITRRDKKGWRLRQQHWHRRHPLNVGFGRRSLPPSQREPQLRPPRFSTRRDGALSRLLPQDFLLQVGFECLDRLASVQLLSRQLLVQARDIHSRLGLQPIERLFPVVHALARETSELIGAANWETAGDAPASIRWLYPLIARSLRGTELPIVMQGYVDVAEWVALWRNQRRVYACLCDGAQLLFFTTKEQCDEFIFERTMRGDETTMLERAEELDHKRILKENTPQTSLNLAASQWSVRKGDGLPERHAFALFDKQGKLRLIMDVTSQREADQWIGAIKKETSRTELFMSKVQPLVSPLSRRDRVSNLTVPLRWLHRHIDSLSRGRACVERAKSWTLTQALKDLRRDRLEINGILYNGLCVDEIVGALVLEITQLAPKSVPADALQFARLLLVTGSRTQGGGDILDAMHVAVGASSDATPQCYFCPMEAARIQPIRIDFAREGLDPETCVVVANIRMEMSYRVLTNMEISGGGAISHDEQTTFPTISREPSEELVLTGLYHRQLVYRGEEWNRLDGSVTITVDKRNN